MNEIPSPLKPSRFTRAEAFLIAVVAALLAGCQAIQSVTGPEPGRHRITITELALSDSDFTNSALGNPKPIELFAVKDGTPIRIGRVEGFRGPKNPGLSFELDYSPQSRYEFKIQEVAVLTEGRSWTFSSSRPGTWVFNDRQAIGSGSSVTFVDAKIQ